MYRTRDEIDRMSVSTNATVGEAVWRLDDQALGLVLVVNRERALTGIVTNGDFRRFILKGGSLSDPVSAAMNSNALVVGPDEDTEFALQRCFSGEAIRYVPLLDGLGRVKDVVFMTDLGASGFADAHRSLPADCPVVVMAGGKGGRLDPFTRVLPKPLIPVGEKPIVEIILDRFAAHGVRHFWLSINHKGRMIRAYFEDAAIGYEVSFLEEDQPLGTAGALSQLAGKVTTPLFVTNCDIIVMADLSSIYEHHQAGGYDLTVVGSAQQHAIPYGVCQLDEGGTLRRIVEKPRYDVVVNTGMYVLSPDVLKRFPDNRRFDMTELIKELLASGAKVGVYPVPESAWLDVGQWEEFRKTVKQLGGADV